MKTISTSRFSRSWPARQCPSTTDELERTGAAPRAFAAIFQNVQYDVSLSLSFHGRARFRTWQAGCGAKTSPLAPDGPPS
eukprot:4764586-Prymnesium_polylepis.1